MMDGYQLTFGLRLVFFLPSIVALVVFSINSAATQPAAPYWMVGNLICSLCVAAWAASPSDNRATHALKVIILGAMFWVLNLFAGFFGGCCCSNTFHK